MGTGWDGIAWQADYSPVDVRPDSSLCVRSSGPLQGARPPCASLTVLSAYATPTLVTVATLVPYLVTANTETAYRTACSPVTVTALAVSSVVTVG